MEKSIKKNILEWIYCIIIAVSIAICIKYFIGIPTTVEMSSMYPTLEEGEKLILSRTNRTLKKLPKRGEIITFEMPSKTNYKESEINQLNPIAKYENEPKGLWNKFVYNVLEIKKISYIKRVVALPGEHVQIKYGKVYINNNELQEQYLQQDVNTQLKNGIGFDDFIVPEGCIFAMGDNREYSIDCRDFGCIPLNKIESIVWIRFYPFNKFGKV